jgi:hypothetical protein
LSGAVTKGTATAYAFTANDAGSNFGATLTSDYGVAYTGGDNPFHAKITTLTLNDGSTKSFSNLPVSFTKALQPGRSYTLLVTFRKFTSTFAASNIYWDGSKLTFDAVPNGNNTKYQGVFFKWGSLVGVSPIGSNTAAKVYVPNYNSGNSPSWDDTKTISSKFTDWNGIPYTTDGTSAGRSTNWVTADAQNTTAKWNENKGDICRYISENGYGPGGKWRMPRSEEFLAEANWTRTSNGWNEIASTLDNGKYDQIVDYATFTADSRIFPASGFRNSVTGGFYDTGSTGYYWSSSVLDSTLGYGLRSEFWEVLPTYNSSRADSLAVRCVLQE